MKTSWFRRIACLGAMTLLTVLSLFGCDTHPLTTTLPVTTDPTPTTTWTDATTDSPTTTSPVTTTTLPTATIPTRTEHTTATVITTTARAYTEVLLFVREPRLPGYLPEIDFLTCTENGIEYFFVDTIAVGPREAFIRSHQELIAYLESQQIFLSHTIKNIVLETYPSRSDSVNGKALHAIGDAGTYKQILIALQTQFGDFTNYGLLYGFSYYIAEGMGWDTDRAEATIQEIVAFTEVPDHAGFLDLTYPCFVPSYVGDALPMIQTVARRFVGYLIERFGIVDAIDLLRRENASPGLFRAEANDLKNDWLASIDSATHLTDKDLTIRFQYGGVTAPLIISTDHAKYYLMNDYAEVDLEMMEIDYLKSDYAHLMEALTQIELDMVEKDLVYKDPLRTYRPLTIVLCNEEVTQTAANSIAYYWIPTITVYSASVWPVNHEYLHYLTTPTVGYNWQYEALASYGSLSDHFMLVFTQNFFDMMIVYGWNGLSELREYLGRDPVANDFATYCEIYIALSGDNDVSTSNGNALYSVPHYVRITYGEDVMNRIFIRQDTIEAEIGRSWPELIEDWQQWIIDTYGYLGS